MPTGENLGLTNVVLHLAITANHWTEGLTSPLPSLPLVPNLPLPELDPRSETTKLQLEQLTWGKHMAFKYKGFSTSIWKLRFLKNVVGPKQFYKAMEVKTSDHYMNYEFHIIKLVRKDMELDAKQDLAIWRTTRATQIDKVPKMVKIIAWNCRGAKNPHN
ncbi:hypothetical protein LIER_21980 [Lithospermum erythrorhizon]|uniref:Uncharacterized protein n=1 Tax=Lithospermum erythrorhizon TaxID=34254 RepID=A0AAV3QV51_LITER